MKLLSAALDINRDMHFSSMYIENDLENLYSTVLGIK